MTESYRAFCALEPLLVRQLEHGNTPSRDKINLLPNWRDQYTVALTAQGAQMPEDTTAPLALGATGRVDAPLDALDEATRLAIVSEVLALSAPDTATLDSALLIASSLRNPRSEWLQRIGA